MTAENMTRIAAWIDAGVDAATRQDEAALETIAAEVREFTSGFPVPGLPA
jgi:glycine hydroxymethyltransferase